MANSSEIDFILTRRFDLPAAEADLNSDVRNQVKVDYCNGPFPGVQLKVLMLLHMVQGAFLVVHVRKICKSSAVDESHIMHARCSNAFEFLELIHKFMQLTFSWWL